MKSIFNEGTLTVYLEGRIDSVNSSDAEKELEAIFSENDYSGLIIDAQDLTYISSAGLRVLLRVRKKHDSFKIINACPEVYDIFEMTGFSEIMTIEKAFRRFSVDGCRVIGRGAKGTVYRYNDDTIIKVYNNPDSLDAIQNERALARKAFVLGIPTAISYDVVKVDGKFGSVFELLDAKSFSQLIAEDPENIEEYAKISADMLKKIHSTEVDPKDMPDVRILINKWLETVAPYFSESENTKLGALVNDSEPVMTMIHGDYHTNNIMMQNDETLLIDMDTLSYGHPVFELANIHITYVGFGENDPSYVENFMGFSYENCIRFWKFFISAYLGTQEPSVIEKAEQKIRLFSYIRLMRHHIRRGMMNDPEGAAFVSSIKDKVSALLLLTNDLDI